MSDTPVRRVVLPAAVRGLPSAFWWIWLSILVNWIGAFAGPMLALSLTLGRGYSATSAGLVVSLLGVGGIVGTAAGGWLGDRIGRRTTMIAGHCWTAVSMALLGLSGEPTAVAVVAFATGIGMCAVRPAAQASIVDLVPVVDRQRAFALNYWALNAGISVSAVLAGLMVGYGYTLLFLADAAATALCALVIFLKVPETRWIGTPSPGVRSRRVVPVVGRDRPFLQFVLMTLLFAVVFEQHTVALPIVMTRDGHSAATYSLLNALNGLLIVALQIPLTRFAARRSRPAVLLVGGILVGWGLGLTAFADSAYAFAFTVVIWTIGEILQAPAGNAVAAERAPVDQRGRYQATYGLAWSTAAFLGPAWGGWVLDSWGATPLWLVCAAVGTVAGAGSALIVGRHQSSRPAPAGRAGGEQAPPLVAAGTGGDAKPERTVS